MGNKGKWSSYLGTKGNVTREHRESWARLLKAQAGSAFKFSDGLGDQGKLGNGAEP